MAEKKQDIPAGQATGDEFWWRAKAGDPNIYKRLVPYGRALLDLYRPAHQEDRAFERIYEARRLRGYHQALKALERHHGIAPARLNVVKSVIDTVVSRLSKQRPMPSFIVNDADWLLKRKAKEYRKFIVGKMNETEFDDLSRDALRDGGIVGTGLTRIDARLDGRDTDDVFAERLLRDELLFDPRESKYGKPRQAVYVHRIAKAYLGELYPNYKSAIWAAPPSQPRPFDDREDDGSSARGLNLNDYCDVFEAWHLPTTSDTEDGIRALAIDQVTLASEAWESPRLPVALFRYAKPLRGIWGKGLVAELKDLQERINSIVRDMQMNLAATGRGYYSISEAADVPVEMLGGFAPFKMKYKGNQPPVFTVPSPINPAQLQMLQFFIQQAFELTGVSQAAASSRSSLGPGASGVALDTQYDIDSERFAMVEAQYARYRLDAARLYLDAAKRVAKRREESKGLKKYVSVWKDRDAIERLEYGKVALQDEDYRLQLEAVNYIPDTKAGKLSVVTQLAQAGVIPQWQVAMLFDEPDIAGANAIALAPLRNCLRKMDELINTDLPVPVPEPYNDLTIEKEISVAYYNLVQNDKAPLEIQERFREYCDLVEDAITKKKQGEAALAAAAAAPPGMGAAPPGAAPGMPGITPGAPTGAAPPTQGGPPALQALQGGIA